MSWYYAATQRQHPAFFCRLLLHNLIIGHSGVSRKAKLSQNVSQVAHAFVKLTENSTRPQRTLLHQLYQKFQPMTQVAKSFGLERAFGFFEHGDRLFYGRL